ncbi:54S ribosomal protein L12 [Penicillium rolfsii]|nr:54S ribosomal protein L12 [Penicillium rolfsii]
MELGPLIPHNSTMSFPIQAAARSCRQLSGSVRPSSLRIATTYTARTPSYRRWESTEAAAAPINPKIAQIVDQISTLTLLETADLVSSLKTRLNIPDLPVGGFAVAGGAAPGAAAPAAEEEEAAPAAAEKTLFNLKLESFEAAAKPKIIKEVKNMLGLSLVESKKFVESVPKVMKESVPKEEAEKIIETLKALGAKVIMDTQCRPAKSNRDSARPAPALRRKRETSNTGRAPAYLASDGVGHLNSKGFYMDPITVDIPKIIAIFKQISQSLYDDACHQRHLEGISFRTFEDVSIKIFKAMDGPPNPQKIRAISTDVDAVYRIGFLSCAVNRSLVEWFTSACALAGARQPTVLTLARSIGWTKNTPHTKWTDAVKQFSDEGFPPAMILQAKILGMRGEYEQAFELMEKRVLPYLTPTRRPLGLYRDITMGDVLESPWRVYALLHASYDADFDSPESRRKADDATRVAALEYSDPKALVEYASIMMNEKNYEQYEECMCKAATFGEKKAILYIANYYYQIFHGRYPTEGERLGLVKAGAEGQQAPPTQPPSTSEDKQNSNLLTSALNWTSSFFNKTMSREDYRRLALDWYTLGYKMNIPQASFMLALMAREQGTQQDGSIYMEHAREHLQKNPEFVKKIDELRDHWTDPEYVPILTSRMLAVR